jgi:ATP-dependent DNA helicase RecG
MEPRPEELIPELSIWNRPLKYGRYLSEKQIQILQKDLGIFTLGDLFRHFPFRYEDRTAISEIRHVHLGLTSVQIKGEFIKFENAGEGKSRRLVGTFADSSGTMEVVWFQKIDSLRKILKTKQPYLVYGRLNHFNGKTSFTHPEVEVFNPNEKRSGLEPVYSTTETLKRFGLDSKGLSRIIEWNITAFSKEIEEPFPVSYIMEWGMIPLLVAIKEIHKPSSGTLLEKARERLKLEELFPLQFFMLRKKKLNNEISQGHYMPKLLSFNQFYESVLPFALTNAQKRVLKEIRSDLVSGKQMNRLVQGDVGSGKTIVALMAMLMAHDNGFQSCLMAPTEILANQHFFSIEKLAKAIGLNIALLTGSTKTSERKTIATQLENGSLHIIIGTHALIEDKVRFENLGLSVIDEQHRFGVAQRARLHNKNPNSHPPHILVMTATPIPRTLAMALYSDLDISKIDELPAGRKEIQTVHRTESRRLPVFKFIREEIQKGRQAYIVYPMIEESETLDLNNLMEGFESISRAFPEYPLSMVHGKMKAADKEFEMARFVKGETKIMVATTVIEVGVNVPNASIMLIENSERFGLTQMHQLRGRVGRGEYQSYCILMTGPKLSREGKIRIDTLCRTSDGFEIAETDLKLRGPGDIMGTKQSGIADLKLTNLAEDGELLEFIKQITQKIIEEDINLETPQFQLLKSHLKEVSKQKTYWNNIS